MNLIKVLIAVETDGKCIMSVTRKVVDDTNTGDLLNYSFFTLRFSCLKRAMEYVEQMARIIVASDFNIEIEIEKIFECPSIK